ncbi:MAG: AgmX/PglI C-terminal domain-containing protein [Myxococcota bacterium]
MRELLVALGIFTAGCAHQAPAPAAGARVALTRSQLVSACQAGEANRCRELAGALRFEPTDALDAECGQARAAAICTELATRFAWALGVEEDLARARTLFTDACAAGFAPACEKLGRIDARAAAERCVPDKPGQGLARDAILEVIGLHVEEPTWCYQRMLAEPGFVVDVTAAWTIGPEGNVLEARTVKDTQPEKQVGECVRAHILQWRFPCPAGGGTVNVTFPWLFRHD